MKTLKRRIKFLEKLEVEKIIAGIKPESGRGRRDYALLQTLFSTGLRISEALALPVEPFLKHETGTLELSIMGKGQKQRVVFVAPVAVKAVKNYLVHRTLRLGDNPSRLFNLTARGAQMMVKGRARAVGLGDRQVTPHVFRHSMATHLLRQGANMRIVQEMLGHSSIATTQVYAGVTNRDLLEAHKKFMV